MGRPTIRPRDDFGRKYVQMRVYPETKNFFKSDASLQGKGLAEYMDEISRREAEKMQSQEKMKRRFDGRFFS